MKTSIRQLEITHVELKLYSDACSEPTIDERQKKGHKRGGSSQNTRSQSIGGTKANIKPTAALKVEKHTQGTGDTGIRNGLIVKVGILVDEAPGTREGCQNKFR
jgi:hypothetical protein